jgi:threonine dehydratase
MGVVLSFLFRPAAWPTFSAVERTPCIHSIPLSKVTGCEIYCKLEFLQRTGSFKERGARNALLCLEPGQRQRGVIAASAGNHALGLAYHASLLGIPVVVVMPRIAPLTKISNCRQMGAEVLLEGGNIEEARQHAMKIASERGLTYINGYDDPLVIAGQGTIALEIIEQVPGFDAIIVPIGGAGLLAGIAYALRGMGVGAKIVGVEPARAASFGAAVKAGQPVPIQIQPTLADGLAVPCVGSLAFSLAKDALDFYVAVSERSIALSILRLVELEKAVVEGAGAAPLAACLEALPPELKGRKVVLPLCGGNIDTSTLGRIIERGLAADGRLCQLSVTISDRPGGLAEFASIVAELGGSIRDVVHDRAFASEDLSEVTLHAVIETRDFDHIRQIRERLAQEGFVLRDRWEN